MKKGKEKYIVIFSAYIPPHVGGIERYTDNLVRYFLKLGYKSVIVTSNYNDEEDFYENNDVTIIRLPVYNIFKNRYPIIKLNSKTRKLIKKLDNYNICSIIVNTRFHLTSHVGVWYANKRKIPVYLIEHGSNYVTVDNKFWDFFANRYEDILTYYLKKRVNGFYGVSDTCSKWLINFKIKASGTWYNSIDFIDAGKNKIKHKGINFLYAGRIIKQKGVYNILISFMNLSKKYKNINLYVVGDGPELEQYKKNFINDRIKFVGRLDYDELLKYYSICDIFLYPPLWPEGLPTAILEAGMMKCSVIATAKGGIKEIIDNEKNGLIISTDVKDLETSMERLIVDSKLRKSLADNLYDTVKNKFSWEVTAKKILKDMGLR